MPDFWERLEAKQVQRTRVPILTGDLRAAQEAVGIAQGALAVHEQKLAGQEKVSAADKKKTTALTDRVKAAIEQARDTVQLIDVQALPAPDYEQLMHAHTQDDDTDLDALLPPLLALSCTDENLRDEQKWAAQLARTEVWTAGEINDLRLRLMGMNSAAPSGGLGKG